VAEEGNPIRLFVTHLYAPDETYFRVFEYLESQPNFYYRNLSTPDKPPRSKEKEAIREDLRRQMAARRIHRVRREIGLPEARHQRHEPSVQQIVADDECR